MPDGGRIWAIDILSPTAIGMRLHFTNFKLPAGASLVAYDAIENRAVAGPYTGTGIKVGIISDAANNRAAAIASGDLPAAACDRADYDGVRRRVLAVQ